MAEHKAREAQEPKRVPMDLSSLDTVTRSNEGVWMPVLHPATLNPLGETAILLAGADSERYQKAQREVQQTRLDAAVNNRVLRRTLNLEDAAEDALEVLVRSTIDWRDLLFSGEPLACTPANVRKVYTALPWLREQVDRFVSNRSNFFRGVD